MNNSFSNALISEKANEKKDLSLYGRFVGEWDFDWQGEEEDGSIKRRKGEWIFSYILEGNGIQDVFICPSRATRDQVKGYAEYGTTLRIPLSDQTGRWHVVYGCDQGNEVCRLIAEEVNGDIIQTGIPYDPNDKSIWQWNFKNISENSFHWEAVWSEDEGRTWHVFCQLDAVRRL